VKARISFLLSLIFLLSSCRPVELTPTHASTIASPQQATATSPTLPATSTAVPTRFIPTFTSPSTPQPTITPAITDEPALNCPGDGTPKSPPIGFGIPGTIVYQKSHLKGLYAMGGKPLHRALFPVQQSQYYFVFGFSPDGNWLAYTTPEYNNDGSWEIQHPAIVLLSAGGQKIEQFSDVHAFEAKLKPGDLIRRLSPSSYWINNELINVFIEYKNIDLKSTHIYVFSNIFNPFAGVWQNDVNNQFTNLDFTQELSVSPDVTRGLYITNLSALTLLDLDNNTAIWNYWNFPSPFGTVIRWAPDSSTAAAVNIMAPPSSTRHLLIIDRNGGMRDIFDKLSEASKDLMILHIKWSPNSRHLGLIGFDDQNDVLLIYDAFENRYIYNCPIIGYKFHPSDLFWSPDGDWIAYEGWPEGPLEVINLQTGEVFKLENQGIAVGWSSQFPVDWEEK
jgi:hypothetical protein